MRFLLTAVIAASLLTPPLLAQSLVGGPRRNAPPTDAMRKMNVFATCIARTKAEDSARLLEAVRGSKDEFAKASALTDKSFGRCATGQLGQIRFDTALLRGGIAEAFYLDRVGRDHVPTVAAELPHNPLRFEKPALAVMALFSGCVVAARPAAVHALLLTEAGSPAELAALDTLKPALGPCLYEGMAADFSRSQLRANFAEAIYRQVPGTQVASGSR